MRLPFSRILKACAPGALVLVLMLQSAIADLVTVHLLDGKSHTVELVSVNRGVLQGKVNTSSDTPVQQFLRSQISYIDFPTTEEWRTAEAAYESGKFEKAISLYRVVISDPAAHFFPMPGNFVSLAQVRILDCHRGRMVPADIAKQAQVVREQFLNLPPSYRVVNPIVTAWKAVSEKNWGKVIESLEEFSPPTPESYFLKGVALEALGKSEEAMQEYAGAYVLNFGGVSNLTKEALKRSAELLIKVNNKDRAAELQAQVKIYRDLFGNGKLWKGAPEWVVKLSEAELNSLVTDVDGSFEKPESAMGSGGTVVESSGGEATLPSIDDRTWVLPHEVEHRFQIFGNDPSKNSPVLTGGAIEETGGVRFDGTGMVKLSGINGGGNVWRLFVQFTPDASDGAVLDFNDGRAGLSLFLADGELILRLVPIRRGKKVMKLGSVPPGTSGNFSLVIGGGGEVKATLNKKLTESQLAKNSFRLGGRPTLFIGDIKPDGKEVSAEGAGSIIPFKGLISLVTLGSGKAFQEIQSDEKLALGGKSLRLFPPDPEAAAKEPAKEEPSQKAAPPAGAAPGKLEPEKKAPKSK